MAIRGPDRKPDFTPQPLPPARTFERAIPVLAQALLSRGLARTPEEAQRVARTLVAALARSGIPPSSAGTPEAMLEADVRALQLAHGLPSTGQLDEPTRRLIGGIEQAAAGTARAEAPEPAAHREPSAWSDFTGRPGMPTPGGGSASGPSKKARDAETDQTRARVELTSPERSGDLQTLIQQLAQAGFAGTGRGSARLRDALGRVQAASGLPVTGKLDEQTKARLEIMGVRVDSRTTPEASARPAVPQATHFEQPAAARASSSAAPAASSTPEPPGGLVDAERAARPDALADPTSRGLADEVGARDAVRGRGEGEGASAAAGGDAGAGTTTEATGQGAVDEGLGDPHGDVNDDRNAPSGDDDERDRRRGHATLDDGSEADEGYYEVPSLASQVADALDGIVRDGERRGAPTYGWDFTLFRPGVYGRRQAAEALLHLVVRDAGPFDEVWGEALAALNARLFALEPDAAPLRDDDIANALRRARARGV